MPFNILLKNGKVDTSFYSKDDIMRFCDAEDLFCHQCHYEEEGCPIEERTRREEKEEQRKQDEKLRKALWEYAYIKLSNSKSTGYRGMTSHAASQVKIEGHKNENKFAYIIGGKVISGQTKPDVESKGGKLRISCKQDAKKYQIFLYNEDRLSDKNIFGELGRLLGKCLSHLPKTKDQYQVDRASYKEEGRESMIGLKEKLAEDSCFSEYFFDKAFFNEEANALALKDVDGRHYIFEPYEFSEHLSKNIQVKNSKGEHKVVFTASLGAHGQHVIVGEIERRVDLKNYRNLKFWIAGPKLKNSLLRLLKREIGPQKSINNGLVILCGKAINFREELEFKNEDVGG